MTLKAPDTLEVQAITDFLYTSSAYAGKTDAEKRRLIKTKLDDYSFGINVSEVGKSMLQSITGSSTTPDEVQGPAVSEGVAMVNAHYDGTTKTAAIKQGKPVAFDMTNGFCVTGVDASWGPDEYKVVGIALRDYAVVNTIGKIPIRLIPPAAVGAEEIGLFMTQAKAGQSYPTYTAGSNRRVFPATKQNNPTWSGTGGGGFSGQTGEEVDAFQTAFLGRWVPEFIQFVGWKNNGKWWFEYVPPAFISATLTEDLILSAAPQYASIGSAAPSNALAVGEKARSFGLVRAGYKYPSGAQVLLGLVGLEYVVVKCYSCPLPQ